MDQKEAIKRYKELDSDMLIPIKVLQDRTLSALECLVEYLKEQKGLNYHQIGVLTNRDERNIWTIYNRAKKKRGKNEEK